MATDHQQSEVSRRSARTRPVSPRRAEEVMALVKKFGLTIGAVRAYPDGSLEIISTAGRPPDAADQQSLEAELEAWSASRA